MSNITLEWIKQNPIFNTVNDDLRPSICCDCYGNTYCTYYTNGTISGSSGANDYDIVVFKLDKNGELKWIKPMLETPSFFI